MVLAIQRTLEEDLYWAAVKLRLIDEIGFAVVREAAFSPLAFPVRQSVPFFAWRALRQELHGQG